VPSKVGVIILVLDLLFRHRPPGMTMSASNDLMSFRLDAEEVPSVLAPMDGRD
jgi:hypothetical protein